uniref:Transposase n=1 Tax=Acrobeloides nanus TaxID=290746 RepID=A0A914CNK3_9BILA
MKSMFLIIYRLRQKFGYIQGVKVNGAEYCEFLRQKILSWAKRAAYGWQNGQWQKRWVCQEDGAPGHKAEETRNLVKDIFPDCIDIDISPQRNNGEWSPNSLDLNVLDYSLWSILEAEAYSKPHQSIEALKRVW